jgi:hypothetical protein
VSRAPAKRFVDIERALRWAYREELPKRHALPRRLGAHTQERVWSPYTFPAGYPEVSPSFREATAGGPSGGYADGWSRDPGFPQALGEPHPDAITMEAAVKGLAAWAGHGFGPDPTAAGLMHGIDHMAVDHVQAGVEAVAAMAGIISVHSRAATRPRWSRKLPEPFSDNGQNGKPKVLIEETFVEMVDRKGVYYEPTRNPEPGAITFIKAVTSPPIRAGLYRQGAYCPLVFRPRPEAVVAERAEYAAWRMGLEILAGELEGKLSAIVVLTPAAAWRPWCFDRGSAGEGELQGRPPELFKALRDEPYRRETREQAAAKRRAAQRRSLQVRAEETRPVTRAPGGRRDNNGTNGA